MGSVNDFAEARESIGEAIRILEDALQDMDGREGAYVLAADALELLRDAQAALGGK